MAQPMTSPVLPLIESICPSLKTWPVDLMVIVPAPSSISKSSQPQTHGLPHPRATTAACEVTPPRAVRIPCEAHIPPTSSGEVTSRTRISFSSERCSASAVEKINFPTAAPGPPARPTATTLSLYCEELSASFAKFGWRICRTWSDSILRMASSFVVRPSLTISMATWNAAWPVRLPDRHWSIHSLPFSTVNSTSCMSPKCFSNRFMFLTNWSYASGRTFFIVAMGSGVRIPATTSSPCALMRYSPSISFFPVEGQRENATPVPELFPAFPKTMTCMLQAVPIRPLMFLISRYFTARVEFQLPKTALMADFNCCFGSSGNSNPRSL
mmetsp:Transcript_58391/g.142801  ORF Transcript_58391/g.142801 Transcript_58391/m.142801 type:complete len:326 (+) Transcript_58391:1457-2434(+)